MAYISGILALGDCNIASCIPLIGALYKHTTRCPRILHPMPMQKLQARGRRPSRGALPCTYSRAFPRLLTYSCHPWSRCISGVHREYRTRLTHALEHVEDLV